MNGNQRVTSVLQPGRQPGNMCRSAMRQNHDRDRATASHNIPFADHAPDCTRNATHSARRSNQPWAGPVARAGVISYFDLIAARNIWVAPADAISGLVAVLLEHAEGPLA